MKIPLTSNLYINLYAIHRTKDGCIYRNCADWQGEEWRPIVRTFIVNVPEAGHHGVGFQIRFRGTDYGAALVSLYYRGEE